MPPSGTLRMVADVDQSLVDQQWRICPFCQTAFLRVERVDGRVTKTVCTECYVSLLKEK